MVPDIEIQHLSVCFDTAQGPVCAVNDLSTTFRAGRISGVIGESGSGKSIMGMSLLRLLPNTARVTGKCFFGEHELYSMPLRQLRKLRGGAIGLIPQNPGASLDPVMKLRRQLTEAITTHGKWSRKQAEIQAAQLLRQFGFEEPERTLNQYAFQMSGGMNQRLVSALGLACRPGWVIADEPTKGLDAVIRNQVYSVLRQIYTERHCSMIVITHDLALAQQLCDDIRVLYMGQIIEQGTAEEVMERPRHPYTAGLIRSLPSQGMVPIPPPAPERLTHSGCPFYPRCSRATARCGREKPDDYPLPAGGKVRCFLYE
ncbi:MAG: ABC transporter ATP-binding protein [Clostridiales bacterium]|uniref:ABC transporter ATP-binding protein n=1 Tax=Flavonifractor porci TaxID=3133422 RepID=UPI0030AFB7FF|nr:ABC transporter ATP-binding protein [Clostridiales bacterium]